MDRNKKLSLEVFHSQILFQPIFLSSTCCSHPVAWPCWEHCMRCTSRLSASIFRTCPVAAALLSYCDIFLKGLKSPLPSPTLSIWTDPTISLCSRIDRISSVASSALHFLAANWMKRVQNLVVDPRGASLRGRPPKSWSEAVKGDLRAYHLNIENTLDRDRWRDAIAGCLVQPMQHG